MTRPRKGKLTFKQPIKYLELENFEWAVKWLIAFRDIFDEDIPPFKSRYEGVLESIIEQVKANYYGKELYPGVIDKAVWMFYCLIKNHPFYNGNKRVAIISLYTFLIMNTYTISLPDDLLNNELYNMAIRVSESKPDEIEKIKAYLKRKIRKLILEA